MSEIPPNLDELVATMRAAAEAATPGQWFRTGSPWFNSSDGVLAGSPDGNVGFMIADCDDFASRRDEYEGDIKLASPDDDAAHIAASSPANVLTILDALAAAQAETAALKARAETAEKERDEAREAAQSWAYCAHQRQFPKIVDPDRLAVIEAAEEWINRACGGEACVNDIAAAVLQAAENAGWVTAPYDAALAAERSKVAKLVEEVELACSDWSKNSHVLLMAGEMTRDEWRSVRACLDGLIRRVRSVLPEVKENSDS